MKPEAGFKTYNWFSTSIQASGSFRPASIPASGDLKPVSYIATFIFIVYTMNVNNMIKPKALQKGDLVAIAAPASPFNRKLFIAGVKKLRELGFEVTFRKDIFEKERYLAGSDQRRAEELNQFFADQKVKAIFFARGGYGTQRILPLLDASLIKASPKIIVGYSDITALHLWLHHHGIGGSFYGPTVARHFQSAPKKTIELLINSITSAAPLGKIASNGARALKHGTAEGTLQGGCISLITSSIGTPYEPITDGTILFLEDVNEPIYKYDRMLTQLKATGKLRGVKSIIFGSLSVQKGENKSWLDKMLKDVLADFPGPIITDFPTGHFDLKKLFVTLPFGIKARIETDPVKLEILESSFV